MARIKSCATKPTLGAAPGDSCNHTVSGRDTWLCRPGRTAAAPRTGGLTSLRRARTTVLASSDPQPAFRGRGGYRRGQKMLRGSG